MKRGVQQFLNIGSKPKQSNQPQIVRPEVLMNPEDAQNSMLRVLLLMTQTQFANQRTN